MRISKPFFDCGGSDCPIISDNGRAEIENRIIEGNNTLRWDKTSCQLYEANHALLKMGVLAYNLLHMIRQFYVWGEEVKRPIDWLIKRFIKFRARVSYHARRWAFHEASAFPLAHHRYRERYCTGLGFLNFLANEASGF